MGSHFPFSDTPALIYPRTTWFYIPNVSIIFSHIQCEIPTLAADQLLFWFKTTIYFTNHHKSHWIFRRFWAKMHWRSQRPWSPGQTERMEPMGPMELIEPSFVVWPGAPAIGLVFTLVFGGFMGFIMWFYCDFIVEFCDLLWSFGVISKDKFMKLEIGHLGAAIRTPEQFPQKFPLNQYRRNIWCLDVVSGGCFRVHPPCYIKAWVKFEVLINLIEHCTSLDWCKGTSSGFTMDLPWIYHGFYHAFTMKHRGFLHMFP